MIPKSSSRAQQLAFIILAAPLALHAQDQSDSPPATGDESGLETIVVTGVASAGGVKKLEASYNIVTANEEEIRRANPKSTADLHRAVELAAGIEDEELRKRVERAASLGLSTAPDDHRF